MGLTQITTGGVDENINIDSNTLKVDGTNNRVGIGTAAPDGSLHVHSGTAGSVTANGNADDLIVESSGTGGISILTPDANHSYVIFGSPTSNEGAILRYRDSDNLFTIGTEDSNGALAFRTGAGSERLRIDSSGNVAIGLTSPTEFVDIRKDQNAFTWAQIQNQNSSSGAYAGIQFGAHGNTWGIANGSSAANSNSLIFVTDAGGSNSEKMRLDSSGRLLVGRTSTTQEHPLQVQAASGANAIAIQGRSVDDQSEITFYENDNSTILGQIQHLSTHSTYRHRAGYIRFDSGGVTEKMRLDSSGRLLVGATSNRGTWFSTSGFNPGIQLEGTGGPGGQYMSITANHNASGYGARLLVGKTRGTGVGATTAVQSGDEIGGVSLFGSDGSEMIEAANIVAYVDGTPGTNDMPGRLIFSTTADGAGGPTERMRIDSAGRLNLGETNVPNTEAHMIRNQGTSGNDGCLRVDNTSTVADHCIASFSTGTNSTATSNVLIKFGINNYNSGSGRINANGTGAAAFGTFSDERLKENIVDLPSQWENVKNLRPVEFDFIESEGGEHQIGFIAQEFETVYADAVSSAPMFVAANEESEEERLVITGWSKTEARLVKALQEAIAKIETLEAKVAALEAAE